MSSAAVFDNKQHSSNPKESTALVICIVLTWTAVSIRVAGKFARKNTWKSLYWDDLLIVTGLVLGTIGPITTLWALTKGGSGTLVNVLIKEGNYHDAQKYLLAVWISSTFLYFALACIRLFILVFYQGIFGLSTKFRRASIALGTFNILWAIGATLGSIFLCKPVSHWWNPLGPGSCDFSLKFLLIVTIFDIDMDFVLLVLPIPQLMTLNVSLRSKIAITGMFCVGIFVVITNIIRIKYIYQPGVKFIDTRKAVLWTSIHITSAFICACLPLSKPLLVKLSVVSQRISQYAISLLSSRGGSNHSLSTSSGRQAKRVNGEPDGEFVHMVDYNSENSLHLYGRIYENAAKIQGASTESRGADDCAPKTIVVENKVEIV